MINQSQTTPKKAQFKQVALKKTYYTISFWKGTSTW